MTTTVRVDDETRNWLERLRAKLSLALDRRVTLEETLRLLTERAVRQPEVLLPEVVADAPPKLSEEEWGRLFALPRSFPVIVRPEDIDVIAAEDSG